MVNLHLTCTLLFSSQKSPKLLCLSSVLINICQYKQYINQFLYHHNIIMLNTPVYYTVPHFKVAIYEKVLLFRRNDHFKQ